MAELAKRELARRNFRDFCRYIYEGYSENWHTRLICDALERVLSGEIRFLMIEAPPRHSKSIHVSQLFPAFAFGQDENTTAIVASYSGELAVDQGRETRNLIASPAYQHLFDTKLAPDSSAKGKWNTTGRGAYNAAGVGGSITGKGARYFIIDDPFKDRKEADSPVIREERFRWMRAVARTRLTPDGAIVLMHTRWHDDDLIGRLTDNPETREDWVDYFDFLKGGRAKWVRLTLKAVAETQDSYRAIGEALWPQRYPLAELEDIKASLGPYEWSALYQQNPVNEASQEFRKPWFKVRDEAELEKMTLRRFATIDTALSTKDGSDYTGVTRNAVNEKNEWHFKSARYRVNAKDLIDLIFLLHEEKHEIIGIEEGAFTHVVEPFLQDEMRLRNKFPNVMPLKHHQTMKETRIRGLIPRYSSGSIFHIRGACTDLESELIRFPKAVNDDCADSAAYQVQIAEPPGNAIVKAEIADTRERLKKNQAR